MFVSPNAASDVVKELPRPVLCVESGSLGSIHVLHGSRCQQVGEARFAPLSSRLCSRQEAASVISPLFGNAHIRLP